MKAFAVKVLSALVFGLLAVNAQAVNIYDNSALSSDQTNRLSAPDNVWFGDEVVLGATYTDRFMTGFDFQYWAEGTAGLTIDIELRLNNGALFNGYATPGTLVYGFYGYAGPFNTGIPNTLRDTIIINSADLDAFDLVNDGGTFLNLDNVTLAVQFHFNGNGGTAGVDLYNPPVEGSSKLDYWQQISPGVWQLTTNNAFGTVNFGMTIEAVPEPTAFSLFIMGGLMALGFRRFFGRK